MSDITTFTYQNQTYETDHPIRDGITVVLKHSNQIHLLKVTVDFQLNPPLISAELDQVFAADEGLERIRAIFNATIANKV